MTLTIVGHGYVGLVSAAILADLGNTVWVVGRTPEKINRLKEGSAPFFEPGLEELIKRNLAHGRLLFTLKYEEAIAASDVVFICVGTPSKEDGQADLSSVYDTARKIGRTMKSFKVVVIKSTVPPGTNKKVANLIRQNAPPGVEFSMASCPEFLREGTAISDSLAPDRVVIGVEDEQAKKLLVDLHKDIEGKMVITNIETAEMIKYVANALLSTKISFANATAILCEKIGADVTKVMEGVGLDKRIGRSFLAAGIGYGGSCFPKDVKALIAFSQKLGYDFQLLKAVDAINNQMPTHFIEKIKKAAGGNLKGKIIGVLGLAFKPNTDDMREAPSVTILQSLKKMGVYIQAYDPVAQLNARRYFPDIVYCTSAFEASKKANLLIVLTEWNEFRQLDLRKVKKLMTTPIIIDGRNIYDKDRLRKLGFIYEGVGRQ